MCCFEVGLTFQKTLLIQEMPPLEVCSDFPYAGKQRPRVALLLVKGCRLTTGNVFLCDLFSLPNSASVIRDFITNSTTLQDIAVFLGSLLDAALLV
jgi:hypothetical protein